MCSAPIRNSVEFPSFSIPGLLECACTARVGFSSCPFPEGRRVCTRRWHPGTSQSTVYPLAKSKRDEYLEKVCSSVSCSVKKHSRNDQSFSCAIAFC